MKVLEERSIHILLAIATENVSAKIANFGPPGSVANTGVRADRVSGPESLGSSAASCGATDNVNALTVSQNGERRDRFDVDIRVQLPTPDKKVRGARGISGVLPAFTKRLDPRPRRN